VNLKGQGTGVTALKVDKNRFYVLRMGKDNWVYASEDEVMKDLMEKIKLNDSLESEDVRVMKVQILKRKWKIQEVPWSKAVLDLVRLIGSRNIESPSTRNGVRP